MEKIKKIRDAVKSLRFIIIAVVIVAGIVPATVLNFALLESFEEHLLNEKMEGLQNKANILKNEIISSGYMSTGKSDMVEAQIVALISGDVGRVMIIDKNLVVIRDTYNLEEGKICQYESVKECFYGENNTIYDEEDGMISVAVSLVGASSNGGVVFMSFSADDVSQSVAKVREQALVLLVIIYIVVLAVAGTAGHYVVMPFAKVSNHIRDLESGKAEFGQANIGYKEMEEINANIEYVILKLTKLNESRDEFVSNVSHELKTPITSIKILADSLNSQENVPNEMYKEFMQDIANEIDRESRIINDLLALMRMNKDSSELQVSLVNINQIVKMVIKRVKPIADKRNIDVILESFKPVSAEVDEVKLTMVITNIIENAVKYNVDDGWVKVSLNADGVYFYLKVSDSGIGIPKDAQIQIFERFFRVDKARSRETGGTGLGLAITKTVVNMHKGDIKLFSREGEGSTFTIRIPLYYIP